MHPGQVQWLTSLSSAETTSLATVLVDWDSKLYIAGFYHVTGHRMHWLAACLSTQGEVLWVQFDNTSRSDTWVHDMQMSASGAHPDMSRATELQ